MARLGISKAKDFIVDTNPKAAHLDYIEWVKKGLRGPHISFIDSSLSAWGNKHKGNDNITALRDNKIKILRTLAKSCAYWLNNNGQKTTALADHRIPLIQQLMANAIAALGTFNPEEAAFARRKTAAISGGAVSNTKIEHTTIKKNIKSVGGFTRPQAKSLDGGYANERKYYETLKEHDGSSDWSAAAGPVHSADQANWDTNDFATYANLFAQVKNGQSIDTFQVTYLSKANRLQYLVVPTTGVFQKPTSQNAYNSDNRVPLGERLADMWAMDIYGNLFVKDSKVINGKGYFNHSSFNAGKDVICAGTLIINQGSLAYIDNQSGHYKPSVPDLRNACALLANECGVNFANVRVGITGGFTGNAPGAPSYFGDSFLNNGQTPWAHNRNAALHIPTVIQAE